MDNEEQPKETFDDRVARSIALQEYVRARKAFEEASERFEKASQVFNGLMTRKMEYVTKVDYAYYLVAKKDDSCATVKPIEVY